MPASEKKRTVQSVINELVERTNSTTQRLRVLEQRTESTDSRMTSMEKDVLENKSELKKVISGLEKKLSLADERNSTMENTLKEMVTQMKRLATNADVRGLQELIDIYNPLKSNFLTREEAERMIEEKILNNKGNIKG
jgi:chromosome segregation ATPase